MLSVVETVSNFARPWAHAYGDSKVLSTVVTFTHLGGLLVAGGFALAADRATLRLSPSDAAGRQAHLEELHSIHRPVLIGLVVTLASGLLLLGADVEALMSAPLFWVKMGLIVVLLGNGAVLRRTETALRRGGPGPERAWQRLRRTAWLSMGLWFGALLLGTALLSI